MDKSEEMKDILTDLHGAEYRISVLIDALRHHEERADDDGMVIVNSWHLTGLRLVIEDIEDDLRDIGPRIALIEFQRKTAAMKKGGS